MSEHKSIYAALAAAQQEFGQVVKGAVNPAFRSKYADLADVANVVIPTMNKNGCAVLHYLVGENLSVMRTEFVHFSTDTKLTCDVPLIVDKNNMQGMKSATTYAKRIGLESLSGIAPEDDDGNAASAARPTQSPPAPAKTAAASREFFTQIVGMVRNAPDTDELESLFRANRAEIEADKFKADILKEFSERKAELEAGQ
jgi:hypothetical protein